ncbi:cationic amino acid transporter 2-like [Anopheles arabiensis]|uniref:AA_permease_C domain-containing protein n=2 Tax=gambiae species complex TaxID=44542 RepID=A0A6E8W0Q0_ANOCL|nr:cationic amino acid transporter 2 [Anopheles gambiae]XP_040168995.1 cationic amino acid transporter 2-like [Anopheles arabiensis]XP_040168996.1 cationic amino acid transporter 2-like [Anopheles arabiensis]XP_040238320.2 cationic amino acid transporter 2-like [Anopheles coluzzii]XP_049465159.1 cationic amino acid transporter 2-like [Anopheles coluzzii]XP_061515053.1 cationic amino acid transporter 2 [Anopheles gambiae]XP_061515054.1 cationic amino acid transporter 2 [Anopheles gambiae]
MENFWKAVSRKKPNNDDGSHSKLARVLTLLDLTGLGVGSTLGLGAYVLAGSVAYEQAGPGVVISFVIAALAAAIAGLCYAEFASRVPKAGSAYIYTYITIGEFAAFTIGWNLMLEYIIGTASVARGLSGYIDALIDHRMGNAIKDVVQMRVSFLAEYPDVFSFLVVLVITALLAYGVKESTVLNNLFTGVNLIVIVVVLVSVGIKADPANWAIKPDDPNVPAGLDIGAGGFLPYGIAGVMAGAAKCFYGYVGFDCIATTGEEAQNPSRNIPLAIIASLIIIFLSYFGVATVLTMALPYYLQDPIAPFPRLFDYLGWQEIKWIVSIGAIFSLCTNSLGAMFPLPRVLYAMSSDGLIFKQLRTVHPKTKTPLLATILSGLFSGTMAMLFNLHQLIDMMSIGTLLAYTIVAVSVLVLRYEQNTNFIVSSQTKSSTVMKQLFNLTCLTVPSSLSSDIVKVCVLIYAIVISVISSILAHAQDYLNSYNPLFCTLLAAMAIVAVLLTLIISCQPTEERQLTFRVPFVPFVPLISIFVNVYLMFQLDAATWVRFLVWLVVGFIIYFSYGIRHSVQGSGSQTLSESQLDIPFAMFTTVKQ